MMALLGMIWCAALALLLCPRALVSRLLDTEWAGQARAWIMAGRRTGLARLVVAAILFVAARELVAMPGSVELSLLQAANAAPYLGALLAATMVAALACCKVALQAHRADQSYWQVRALTAFNGTFGRCARRKRGNASPSDGDDPAAGVPAAA